MLNYFMNIIPKFSCGLPLITEFQVEKYEGKGTSCNTENKLIGPNWFKCFISQVQQMPKVVARPTLQ